MRGSVGWRSTDWRQNDLHGTAFTASTPALLPAVLSHVLGAPVPAEKVRHRLTAGFMGHEQPGWAVTCRCY